LGYRDFLSQSASAITMRTDMPPFTDVRVRRAISHAIDRQALIEAVWVRGAPTPAVSRGLEEWTLPIDQLGAGQSTTSTIRRRPDACWRKPGIPRGLRRSSP